MISVQYYNLMMMRIQNLIQLNRKITKDKKIKPSIWNNNTKFYNKCWKWVRKSIKMKIYKM